MKNKKNFSAMLFALLALICVFTMTAVATDGIEEPVIPTIVDSGECGAEGDNVLWKFYSDGLLEITGIGDMADYKATTAPWVDYRLEKIKTLVIDSGVTKIGDYAFDNCRKLASVKLPANLEFIGSHAFSTTNLTSIKIPDTVKEIGEFAFYNTELNGIEIPSSVTTIGEAAFMLIEELTSVEVPNTVINIGTRLFEMCYNLVSVKLPDNMKEIPERMFWYCYDLTDITIPSTVTKIGDLAFWYATSLAAINIPSSVKEIGTSAFGYTALTAITLTENVEFIDVGAFRIPGLQNINVVANNPYFESVDGVIYTEDMSELVAYPGGKDDTSYVVAKPVALIRDYAFYYAKNLESVTIYRNITRIGNDAFYSGRKPDVYYMATSEEWKKVNTYGSGMGFMTIYFHEGHTMSSWIVDSAANCQVTGEKSRYCTDDCGYTETEVIPSTVHSMSEWYTVKNPTCTVNGQLKSDCIYGCGTSTTKAIATIGHKDDNPFDGYCDVCGAETDAVKNCSCNCHKGGFMGFIWKIMSFFQRLFKANQMCSCGMAHY